MRLSLGEFLALEARRRKPAPGSQPEQDRPERDLQGEIEAWLEAQGADAAWVRNRMDKATTCRPGTPDFTGCYKGRPFALECKRKGGKPTLVQQGELLRWRLAGASVGVVYTLDEARQIVEGKAHV